MTNTVKGSDRDHVLPATHLAYGLLCCTFREYSQALRQSVAESSVDAAMLGITKLRRGTQGRIRLSERLLQDTMCVRSADLIDNNQIRRVWVGMCDPGAGDYHEDSLTGDIIGTEGG